MSSSAPAPADPAALQHVVEQVKAMYPHAEIRVRRGRVFAIEGNLVRWITYSGPGEKTPGRDHRR